MNEKKILWVSPWFGNYRIPVYSELNKLSNGNFHLICSKDNLRDLVINKVKKTLGDNATILAGEKKSTIGNLDSDFANAGLVVKRQPGLYKAIRNISPDVIICIGFGGWAPLVILYSILNRKKLCMVYERTKYVERNSPIWRTWWRRIIGRSVDLFFINGKLCEEYLNDVLWYKNKKKVLGCMVADSYNLYDAVSNVPISQKESLSKMLNLKNGLTFLFVGQLVERKGVTNLLSAWMKHINKNPSDNLIIIGSGILKDTIMKQYGDCESIHIVGGVPYDEIHLYYNLCDVFIMPTLEDNWCLVVPEAMACAKPIACSIYNGGYYELVKDGVNGKCFDPLNNEDIVNTLSYFHTVDLNSMGKESVKIEKNFSPDVAARKMFDAITNLF